MIMYTLCIYIYILSMERHFISDYIFYFGRPLKNIPNFYKIRNCFGNRLGLEIPQKNTWWSIDDRDILYWDWNRLVSLCIMNFWQEPRGSLQCICQYCQRFAMDTLIPYQIVCVCVVFVFFGTLFQDIVNRLLRDVVYVSAGVPCSDVLDPYGCWVTNQPSQSTIVLQRSNPSARKTRKPWCRIDFVYFYLDPRWACLKIR